MNSTDNRQAREHWNRVHASCRRDEIRYDNWLDDFSRQLEACGTPVIDLGCGSGNNTLYLIERGIAVIPCDYSQSAIRNIRGNFPEIPRTECFDMTEGLPFGSGFTDLIIADLSLHYFDERTTFRLLAELRRVLKPEGLLLFRVNSVRDANYGAGQGVAVEKHLYRMENGQYKRFFDREDVAFFFRDWRLDCVVEERMTRYGEPKILWKCAASPQPQEGPIP